MKKTITGLLGLLLLLLTAGCDSADCTLNNTVLCHIAFYNGEGKKVALADTLTITAYGTDETLFNRGVGKAEVALPMSYYADEDTLVFQITGKDNEYRQVAEVAIKKSNTEYFEGTECAVKMFHGIEYAYILSGRVFDSIVVVKPSVNFQQDENIRIYVH